MELDSSFSHTKLKKLICIYIRHADRRTIFMFPHFDIRAWDIYRDWVNGGIFGHGKVATRVDVGLLAWVVHNMLSILVICILQVVCTLQDGSCNGLQHYAALGRDQEGAQSVNLWPYELPQDVYSDVCELVSRLEKEQIYIYMCITRPVTVLVNWLYIFVCVTTVCIFVC